VTDATAEGQVENVLAGILREPWKPLAETVESCGADLPQQARVDLLLKSKRAVAQILGGELTQAPRLVERLSMCWKMLQTAQTAIRSYKGEFPTVIGKRVLFDLWKGHLPVTLDGCLIEAICEQLSIGQTGGLAHAFKLVLSSKKPKKLPIPIVKNKSVDWKLAGSLSSWLIRRTKDKYVHVRQDGTVEVHMAFVVGEVSDQMEAWLGVEVGDKSRLHETVEDSFNQWMSYSAIEGDQRPDVAAESQEIARSFAAHNRLTGRITTKEGPVDDASKQRIRLLELEVERRIKEVAELEERLAQLPAKQDSDRGKAVGPPSASQSDGNEALLKALQTIDSKYPLDLLKDIELGADTPLTLRNFVRHLFYSCRKSGLDTYPTEEEVQISYEESPLYDCIGFEVSPGETVDATVEKRGWCLRTGEAIVPVRRAQVRRTQN
jgi:hypothetical protein